MIANRPGDESRHRQRRRDHADRQMARQRTRRIAQRFDLLLQRRPVVENGVRPLEDALAVRREAVKTLAALDDRDAELLLELADAARERGLRHVAGLRGAREVLLTRQRHQILQLPDIHPTERNPCQMRAGIESRRIDPASRRSPPPPIYQVGSVRMAWFPFRFTLLRRSSSPRPAIALVTRQDRDARTESERWAL